MNTFHKGITTLLRSAITGEKLPLPEDFDLEEADELIRRQSLLPMAYLGAYNCGISMDTELMRRYKQQYFKYLVRHEQQMREVKRICQAFEENDIDYALLKGCVMKPLYPNPEMRIMGDADILIRMEQYDKIRQVMEGLEYEEEDATAYHYGWGNKLLLAELHYNLHSPDDGDFTRCLGNIWNNVEKCEGNRWAMTEEDAYLHIFTHMTRHFRGGGIGARQIVDLQVYRMVHLNMNEKKLADALEIMELTDFHNNILNLLKVWFGRGQSDALTDMLTAYVFSGGNWGTTEASMYSEALRRTSGDTKRVKNDSVLRTIFPNLSYMQPAYNTLFRHPWLLPIFWVIRWFDILINRRKNIGKRLGILKNMSEEKVSERKAFLDAVGLNFYEK